MKSFEVSRESQTWRKMLQNVKCEKNDAKYVMYTFCFSHFVSVSCYFEISV